MVDRLDDDACGDRVDRVTQVGVVATDSIPVAAQVIVVAKRLRVVVAGRVRWPHREIERAPQPRRPRGWRRRCLWTTDLEHEHREDHSNHDRADHDRGAAHGKSNV